MKPCIAIYLAGTIKKGHESSDKLYWSEVEISLLKECLKDYSVSFLNPAFRSDDLSDSLSVFGRDMLQVAVADIVLVDARGRCGLGVGAEMMWAKSHNLPVLTWSPKDTHYHKTTTTLLNTPVSDWIHPFVFSLSDAVLETLQDGAQWIINHIEGKTREVKDFNEIYNAIEHYMDTQLEADKPMLQLLDADSRLMEKANELRCTFIL